jgi:cytochrome P450
MFYSSANRDEQAIDRPHELDLSREPNPMGGFGGGGIHHCLGNQLAAPRSGRCSSLGE